VHNSQIQLVANPNYWGGKPAFQRIVIRHFEDGAQMLALRRGDIDVAFNMLPDRSPRSRATRTCGSPG
jgi:peptide/nickel transport system substrate-binding protein